jgi:hypothetical protein
VGPEVTLGPILQECDVRCAQTKTPLLTSSPFFHRQQQQPQQPFSHPPTNQSIMMQMYITLIILLSFVHHIKMGGHTKAPATTRLRIFSRGFSLQSLPRRPAHTRNTHPRRFDTF